jgi:hypothetical protein
MVITAAALVLVPGLASARPATAPTGWRTIASIPSSSLLLAVTAPSPGHAWAVGYTSPATRLLPLVTAWDGATWAKVALPPGAVTALGTNPALDTTAASGPANVWAFTDSGRWLHFNGSTWAAGRIASPAPTVQASLAFGPDSAWAFGGSMTGFLRFSPFASRFTVATGWRRTPVPGRGLIAGVSAVSARDIWAVIGTGVTGIPGPGALVHWSAGRWQTVTSLPAALRNASLGAVLARGDSSVWVGGAVKNSAHGTTEELGHWNGHAWTVIPLSAAASARSWHVAGLTVDGHGGLWALGFCLGTPCGAGRVASRLWHEVSGRWTGPIIPALARRSSLIVGFAPVAHSVWGAGVAGIGGVRPSGLIALWGAIP